MMEAIKQEWEIIKTCVTTNNLSDMRKILWLLAMLVGFVPTAVMATEYVTMTVGETKTLYLPSSVTSKRLHAVNFLSYGVGYVNVVSHSLSSVTVKALKKTPSAGVIVRCDYTYFVLRDGKYMYLVSGAYDFNVKVKDIEPTGVSLPSSVNLQPDESRKLTATLYPSNATTDLKWESSASSIVRVWQDGKIQALRQGTSVITVTTGNGKKAQCRVVVSTPDVLPTSVSITSPVTAIKVGDEAVLSATVLPVDATDKNVTWSSSHPAVISVDASSGRITGHQVGYATITVRTCNGLTSNRKLECKDNLTTITLKDADGWSGTLPSIANVNYERRFLKGWNTMCVPFAVTDALLKTASPGLRMAIVKEIEVEGDRRNIVLQSVNSVKGGQPCLVYAASDVTWTVCLKSVALTGTPLTTSVLKGSYASMTIGAGCAKVSPGGTSFGWTKTESARVCPFRCYIE